jgi:hypothetical protein
VKRTPSGVNPSQRNTVKKYPRRIKEDLRLKKLNANCLWLKKGGLLGIKANPSLKKLVSRCPRLLKEGLPIIKANPSLKKLVKKYPRLRKSMSNKRNNKKQENSYE